METCVQCKRQAESFGVVGLKPINDASEEEKNLAIAQGPGSDGRGYVALPICSVCHQRPTIGAHFFFREQLDEALNKAGSMSLGK